MTEQHITFGDPHLFNAPRHAVEVTNSKHERWASAHLRRHDKESSTC